jgi:hypothetical protein
MRDLIESIINKQYDSANELLESTLYDITIVKLEEAKKATSAKMSVEGSAFLGMPGSNSEKLERGVTEMDLSREKPDYSSIEDRRGTRDPSWFMKNVDIVKTGPKTKAIVAKEPEKFDQVVKKTAMKEEKESGEESSMVRSELNAITKDAKSIMSKVKGNKELEAWTQSKITKAADYLNSVADYMDGEEKLDEARIKIHKARVRGGKVQRRKRVSDVEGYKLHDGKLKRMSPAERRRRKLGQKRGKLKRRSKMRMTLMKRKRSLRKRASIGL